MKIVRLSTYHAAPRWLFVKIETDEGITGWGEPVIEGRSRTVEAAVHELGDYLIGKDPARINDLWQTLYRGGFYRGGAILMSAIAGIDQALWDIKGKRYQAPVWDLLGGRVRDKVRAMLVIPYGTSDEVVASCKKAVSDGYTALKVMVYQPEHHLMSFGKKVQDMVDRIAAIREAVGWEPEIGIELHRNMAFGESIAAIREFEQFRPLFVEDPIPPDSVLSFGEVADCHREIPSRSLGVDHFQHRVGVVLEGCGELIDLLCLGLVGTDLIEERLGIGGLRQEGGRSLGVGVRGKTKRGHRLGPFGAPGVDLFVGARQILFGLRALLLHTLHISKQLLALVGRRRQFVEGLLAACDQGG